LRLRAPVKGSAMRAPLLSSRRSVSVKAAEPGPPGGEGMNPSGWSGGVEKALFGENLGARDPTKGEIETNFSDKVWFNWDTEHIVKPPDAMAKVLGLRSRTCVPLDQVVLLSQHDCERLRNQVPGWRLELERELACIKTELRVKSPEAGEEMMARVRQLSDEHGHQPHAMSVEAGSMVVVELSTAPAGGLTENDFIIAAKINDMEKSDLAPPKRQRFWA